MDKNKSLKQFSINFSIALLIWGIIIMFKNINVSVYLFLAGLVVLLSGIFVPAAIKPLNTIFSKIAIIINNIITVITLSILFYLIITPLGLVCRITGKKFLDMRIDRKAVTYWLPRKKPDSNRETCRRQY